MGQHGFWYIVQCNPNCERKAVSEIRRAGFRAHMPKLSSVRRHHRTGEMLIKRRPLMTGYIFMRFTEGENWYALRQCQGVKGVLYIDGHPFRLAREEVAIIMRAQRSMRYEDRQTRDTRREMRTSRMKVDRAVHKAHLASFRVGMHVTVPMTAGERLLARIEAITKRGAIKAVVLSEGKEMAVELTDVDNLKPVDGHRDAA